MNNKIEMLKNEIIKNGGLTINKDLKKVNCDSGFMVSILGYEFTTKSIEETIQKVVEYTNIIKDKQNLFVGVWIDKKQNNLIYIDISKLILNRRDAETTAKKNLQLAIYSNKLKDSIYLDYDFKFYTVYKNIYNKKNELVNQLFIKNYDTMHDIPSNYRNDKKTYFIDTELMNIKDYNNIVIREV